MHMLLVVFDHFFSHFLVGFALTSYVIVGSLRFFTNLV